MASYLQIQADNESLFDDDGGQIKRREDRTKKRLLNEEVDESITRIKRNFNIFFIVYAATILLISSLTSFQTAFTSSDLNFSKG